VLLWKIEVELYLTKRKQMKPSFSVVADNQGHPFLDYSPLPLSTLKMIMLCLY